MAVVLPHAMLVHHPKRGARTIVVEVVNNSWTLVEVIVLRLQTENMDNETRETARPMAVTPTDVV
jgi:hypothetical protein